MVTYIDHLKNILIQVHQSYSNLKEVKDKPGDLENIKKEMLKISGFLKVITNKIDVEKIPSSDFKPLKSKFQQYLQNYSFEQEIETQKNSFKKDLITLNLYNKAYGIYRTNKIFRGMRYLAAKL